MKTRKLVLAGLLSLTLGFSAIGFNSAFAEEANQKVLNGDILVDGNTHHDAIHETEAGSPINYESTLDVKSIKDQIQAEEDSYSAMAGLFGVNLQNNLHRLALSGTVSEFMATLDVSADQVDLSGITKDTVTLTENPLFKIADQDGVVVGEYVQDGKNYAQLLVKMVLKKDNYANFAELKADVMATPDVLEVKTTGAKVKDTVAPGDKIQARGDVRGNFTSNVSAFGVLNQTFDFNWVSKQLPEGVDFDAPMVGGNKDEMNIYFTSLVKEKPVVPADPGDPEDPVVPEEPKQPEQPAEKPSEPKAPAKSMTKGPETSDNFGLELAVAALGLSAVGTLALRRKNRD